MSASNTAFHGSLALILSLSAAAYAQEVDLTPGELEPGAQEAAVDSTDPDQGVTTALVAPADASAASLDNSNQWLANRTGGVPVAHVVNPTGASVFVPMQTEAEYQAAVSGLQAQGIAVNPGCPPQTVSACSQSLSVGYGQVGWSVTKALSPNGSATLQCGANGNWTVTASTCPATSPPPPSCTVGPYRTNFASGSAPTWAYTFNPNAQITCSGGAAFGQVAASTTLDSPAWSMTTINATALNACEAQCLAHGSQHCNLLANDFCIEWNPGGTCTTIPLQANCSSGGFGCGLPVGGQAEIECN